MLLKAMVGRDEAPVFFPFSDLGLNVRGASILVKEC